MNAYRIRTTDRPHVACEAIQLGRDAAILLDDGRRLAIGGSDVLVCLDGPMGLQLVERFPSIEAWAGCGRYEYDPTPGVR